MRKANENVEEWMGKIRAAAIECNYKETYRELKEQFIHGLNDSDLLTEIIRELIKTGENRSVTSVQVWAWAKRIETQRTQAAVINSLSEVKEFDWIQTVGDDQKQNGIKPHTHIKTPTSKKCKYCSSNYKHRWCTAYEKKCKNATRWTISKRCAGNAKGSVVHNIDQEADQEKENHESWHR